MKTFQLTSCRLLVAFMSLAIHVLANYNSNSTYDYIVVGSGPGGGPLASILALNGQSVLLVEAGDDESASIYTQVPAFADIDTENKLHWDFFVRHYASLNRTLKHNHVTWRLTDGAYWVGTQPPAGAELLGK